MKQPVISIILPTYNGARFLARSIESCLRQTFRDFELVIVNDCSTDHTLQVAESYAAGDDRIRIINNAFNKKLPLSLNTGFEAARGTYFTWTSDDNIYAPHALQVLLEALEGNSAADLVYADFTLIDEQDAPTGTRVHGDVNLRFSNWVGCGACFLYKREVHARNNGYNPGAFLIEDYDFFVRAFLNFRFQYLPRTDLYFYREHGASLTVTQSSYINDVSKIFLERNLPGLEKKLPAHETALLYRKFAVHYAVTKNNNTQYRAYLEKLARHAPAQALVTVLYVLAKKFAFAFSVGLSGLWFLPRALFRNKKNP